MSREIEFRGRHKLDGKWVVGNLIKMFGEWCIQNPDNENDVCIVDPETIGQYTGLKDKGGVKIYEGEVIHLVGLGLGDMGCYEVEFNKDSAEFLMYFNQEIRHFIDHHPEDEVEIIGNIHENPELLEAK